MAFNFKWSDFPQEFYDKAQDMLTNALNKGTRPAMVADKIVVKELNFGTIAPELEILEIGELSEDKFKGILKLTYNGDAFIELTTKLQVNPVIINSEVSLQARRGILAAHQPLIMPMLLKLSQLKLRGIITLSLSKSTGIALSFKNDPLVGIEISSSFDDLEPIRSFLQSQIETKLRSVLIDDLPQLFYSLSDKIIAKKEVAPSRSSASVPSSPPTPLYSPYSMRTKSPEGISKISKEFNSIQEQENIDYFKVGYKTQMGQLSPNSHTNNSYTSNNENQGKFYSRSPPLPKKDSIHPRRNFSLDHFPSMTSVFTRSSTSSSYFNHHTILTESNINADTPSCKSPTLSTFSTCSHNEAKIYSRGGQIHSNSISSPPSHGLKDLLEPDIKVSDSRIHSKF